jgi:dTDP-4-dehydrorhamnose reductase
MCREKPYSVAVTGRSGQLGSALAELAPGHPGFHFLFLPRDQFPLDDADAMCRWLDNNRVDYFINCAAYTAVDKAESETAEADRINATAPGIIAERLAKYGARLIHLSTDYVFDGTSSRPLDETAGTHPVNRYGISKLKGEMAAQAANPETLIIRTSWLYSRFGNNFVKTMLRLMETRESIQVVDDQYGSPTYASDLAMAVLKILSAETFIPGMYHYSNEGSASWFDFACEIKKITGSSCTVNPVASSGYPTVARRPSYSLLDKSKIKKDYGLLIPDWKDSLSVCLRILLT